MIVSSESYQEMNTAEIMQLWHRVHYTRCLCLYESPNHRLWALVNESLGITVEIRDVNTGQPYKSQQESIGKTELKVLGLPVEIDRRLRGNEAYLIGASVDGRVEPQIVRVNEIVAAQLEKEINDKVVLCKNCDHEIRWETVAVPPRWEHVRVMSVDECSRLHWICECGCMTPEPKEATV